MDEKCPQRIYHGTEHPGIDNVTLRFVNRDLKVFDAVFYNVCIDLFLPLTNAVNSA